MSLNWSRSITAALPHAMRQELRRAKYAWQIRRGRFRSPEPEYACMHRLIQAGDWVIDIGANVGHYTARMSELAGPRGRVIAFEPLPATFEVLAANSRFFAHPNVTLINTAAGDRTVLCGMSVPDWKDGLPNYYRAHLAGSDAGCQVLCCPVDMLRLPHRVALVKIDVEGLVPEVLAGARALIERDRPLLILEAEAADVAAILAPLDYAAWRYPESPNLLLGADWTPSWEGPQSIGNLDRAGRPPCVAG